MIGRSARRAWTRRVAWLGAAFATIAAGRAYAQEPRADAAPCDAARIDELARDLEQWGRLYREAERRAYADRDCDRPAVICLDRLGRPTSDKLPSRVPAGELLSVYVIAPTIDSGRITLFTAVGSVAPRRSKKPEDAPVAAAPHAGPSCEPSPRQIEAIRAAAAPVTSLDPRGLARLPAAAATEAYWDAANGAQIARDWLSFAETEGRRAPGFTAIGSKIAVPEGDSMGIDFTRTDPDQEPRCLEAHYDVPIDSGRYFVELAALVPFVYRGTRALDLVAAPGTGDRRVAIEDDWRVSGAVMLDFFPLGRQRGKTTSFQGCRTKSCIESWLGLQVGGGFIHPFEEWYGGVLFQPIAGLNFSAGGAFVKGDFLLPGRSEGMQLPLPASEIASSKYMLRPYFGFSVSLDILTTLRRAAQSIRD